MSLNLIWNIPYGAMRLSVISKTHSGNLRVGEKIRKQRRRRRFLSSDIFMLRPAVVFSESKRVGFSFEHVHSLWLRASCMPIKRKQRRVIISLLFATEEMPRNDRDKMLTKHNRASSFSLATLRFLPRDRGCRIISHFRLDKTRKTPHRRVDLSLFAVLNSIRRAIFDVPGTLSFDEKVD